MKKIIALLLLILLFFNVSTPIVYGYWNSMSVNESETITIGVWDFIPTWDSSTTYVKGDIVKYNGITYIAKRTSTNVQPPNNGVWRVV